MRFIAVALLAVGCLVSSAARAEEPAELGGLLVVPRIYEKSSQYEVARARAQAHAVGITHRGFLDVLLETSPQLRQIGALKPLADKPREARELLSKSLRCEVIPGSLLIRLDVDRSVFGDSSAEVIRILGDAAIVEQQKAAYDRITMDLGTAKQWKERYSRELQRIKDTMQRIDSDLRGSGAPRIKSGNIRELELSSLVSANIKVQAELTAANSQLESFTQSIQNGNDPSQVMILVRTDPSVKYLEAMVGEIQEHADSLNNSQGPKSATTEEANARLKNARERLQRETSKATVTYRNQLVDSQKATVQQLKLQNEQLAKQIEVRQAELSEQTAKYDELEGLRSEREEYKKLEREMTLRVETLKSELAEAQGDLQWYRMPAK